MISSILLAAVTLNSISIDTQCDGKFSSYSPWPAKLESEKDVTAMIMERFKKDTDPKLAKDKETLKDANARNKNASAKTIDLGNFEGVKLKATMIGSYYSLKDLYIGKTEAIVWQDKGGKALPLYSVSSCHYTKPELVLQKTSHGSYLVDNALASISSPSKAPVIWKLENGTAVRTSIDNTLESEASKLWECKKAGEFALAGGFDIESLTYTGKTKSPQDNCAACFTGPTVQIKLTESKDGSYKATTSL